ncbi:unnamed protein product [Lactuca virosa]|uniref:Replication protein A OB domain-containing protein n=1 Tax=Lactuca virosa TaxID=75947 RepID=A0AAU9PRR7_9ASTR|nr:unnamed protein product [Lactuca virosa]
MDEGKFQLINQMQKLTFTRETTVTPCLDFSGSVNGFAFIDFNHIIADTVPENISLDVIGLVVAIGEIDARNEDRNRHKMRLQIQDVNGSQLDVNLWGDYCYTFSDYIQQNQNIHRIVIILQFEKICVWQDRRYVNTYYDVSKFIINTDIDEIKVFKKSPHENSSSTFSYMKSNLSSEKDDFVLNHELKTIAGIFEPIEGNKIQGYVPNAYIYKFRKVLKEGEAFFIKNPNLAKMDEGKFQLIDQMQKLTFTRETTVTPFLDFSGSVNEFAFIDFNHIITGTVLENILLDVIGLVVAIGEIDARNEDRKMHKMRLQIQDVNGSQLDVNLWGDSCYIFSDYIQQNPNIHRIVKSFNLKRFVFGKIADMLIHIMMYQSSSSILTLMR